MTIWCSSCETWSALPADGGGDNSARVVCEHCQAPLQVESKYSICADCGRYHRVDYDTCPFCVEEVTTVSASVAAADTTYSVEAQQRRSKRGEDYYLQLYIDYRDKVDEPALSELTQANGNDSYSSPSNGHREETQPGSSPNGYAKGNGHSNSNSQGSSATHVDLAITESGPLMLFTDESAPGANEAGGSAPVTASAGNYNEFDYELIQDPSRLAYVADLLANEKVLGLDTETTGLDPHTSELLLLQVSTLDKVYIVDCKRLVPLALKGILENPQILKIAQNAKFEYEMLRQQTGITVAGIFDTMLAERLLTAGVSREISLKAIAQKYIGATLDKTVREAFYKMTNVGDSYLAPDQLHYAARDAFIMMPIWRDQVKELKKHGLEQVADLEFRCIAAVGDMELAGVQIDEARWRKIIEDVLVQRDKAADELCEVLQPATMQTTMFGVPSINLNSNVQLLETFSKLGVDLPDTMEATLSRFNHPAVAKLLEYRGLEKTLSAFGESVLSLINPKTKRIHPDFNQYGADTGRFSCTRPNVQQIPATSDFRKCFIAAPGYKLVTCDYSQAELRILAELSGDPAFVEAFKSGADLHTLTASQMFGVPVADVQKPQRNAAKAINFGLAYGMGPGGLAPRLGVSLDEAKGLISKYFKAYPGVQKWLDKAAKDAVRVGYSATSIGRKRFYNLPDESLKRTSEDDYRKQIAAIERQGKNTPIQGCLSGESRIFEKNHGYTRIKDLAGQEVEVWDGERFARATVLPSGKKQLVRLTLRGGHYIECSPDHKFWVACNNGYKWAWKWKKPEEIRAQNRVCLTQPVGEWELPLQIEPAQAGGSWNAKPTSLIDIIDLPKLGEWLGRVASDGSVKGGYVALFVAEHEEAILPELQEVSSSFGHVGHRVRVNDAQPKRFHMLTVSSRSLVRQLQEMEIKERVPACAWRDSRVLSGYLRGLFDGNGTVHPDGALLTFGRGVRHLAWAREVQEALLLFGIRSRISVYSGKHYRINLRIMKKDMPLFCEKIGFLNPAKQERASRIVNGRRNERISPQYGMAMLVESVEVTDEWIDMYDVVNSETGRFMANGMVVHNSNADMTKLALIYIREALKGWDARTVNTVHDEIVVEVHMDQAEEVKNIVEHEMVRAGNAILNNVPIVAESSLADYWSK